MVSARSGSIYDAHRLAKIDERPEVVESKAVIRDMLYVGSALGAKDAKGLLRGRSVNFPANYRFLTAQAAASRIPMIFGRFYRWVLGSDTDSFWSVIPMVFG